MKRFMIGQFDKFDLNKQMRDYRSYFWGIEANSMESIDELEKLLNYKLKEKINIGFHFPILKNQWRLRDPQYLSQNNNVVKESIRYMNNEFKRAQWFNPEYILLHYPKPVILDDNVDWSSWRFADDSEYYYESEYSYGEFEKKSRIFFRWLSQKGDEFNFSPLLELDVVNRYIYDTNLLVELLDEFPSIKLCLDIGRIHLQDSIDSNFEGFKFIQKYSKYAALIHLWNVKVETNTTNSHYPALKSLKVEDGWGNVEEYFRLLNLENKHYKVLFEHKSHLISDDELEECYQWVRELVTR